MCRVFSHISKYITLCLSLVLFSCIKEDNTIENVEIIKCAMMDSSVLIHTKEYCINSHVIKVDSTYANLNPQTAIKYSKDYPQIANTLQTIADNYQNYDWEKYFAQKDSLPLQHYVSDSLLCANHKTHDFIHFYQPLFDENKTHAIIYVDFVCHGLCGSGWLILYEKSEKQGWIKVGKIELWVS